MEEKSTLISALPIPNNIYRLLPELLRRKEKARDEGNNENLGFACKSLGDFYNQQGRYHEACKEYQQGTNIFSKLGKQLETAICNRMMAETFMLLGESEKALKHANIFLSKFMDLAFLELSILRQ